MAIDFEKIRQKVEQLAGKGRKSDLWRPESGKDYQIRLLPWPDGNDGQPFKERAFYYNLGDGRPILAPFQFNKPDPIQELITKLRNEGTVESLELAKQFYPKRRYYAPIVVRSEEELGVRLWSFGKPICEKLLSDMLGDFGDITDIKTGRDCVVKCEQKPGNKWLTTTVQPRIPQTPLSDKPKQVKDWTTTVPDLDEIYTLIDISEIEKRVNDHIQGPSSDDGTERNSKASLEMSDAESNDVEDAFAKLKDIAEED